MFDGLSKAAATLERSREEQRCGPRGAGGVPQALSSAHEPVVARHYSNGAASCPAEPSAEHLVDVMRFVGAPGTPPEMDVVMREVRVLPLPDATFGRRHRVEPRAEGLAGAGYRSTVISAGCSVSFSNSGIVVRVSDGSEDFLPPTSDRALPKIPSTRRRRHTSSASDHCRAPWASPAGRHRVRR